jgi:hypothetical protein
MRKWYVLAVLATLFAAVHYVVAFEHWRQAGPQQEPVLGPLTLAVVSTLLAERAFRRTVTTRRRGSRPDIAGRGDDQPR